MKRKAKPNRVSYKTQKGVGPDAQAFMDDLNQNKWDEIQASLNGKDMEEDLKQYINDLFTLAVKGIENCGELIFKQGEFEKVKEAWDEIVKSDQKEMFVDLFFKLNIIEQEETTN